LNLTTGIAKLDIGIFSFFAAFSAQTHSNTFLAVSVVTGIFGVLERAGFASMRNFAPRIQMVMRLAASMAEFH
jgi:hypothetical protein